MQLETQLPLPHVFVQIPEKSAFEAAAEIAKTVFAGGRWIILHGSGSVAHRVAEALKHIAMITRSAAHTKDKTFKSDGGVVLFEHGLPLGIAVVDGSAAFVHVHDQRQHAPLPRGFRLGQVIL